MKIRIWLKRGAVALGASLLFVQFIPYGQDHTNPPVTAEPAWSTSEVRSLAERACFDCHSNQTRWPAYSRIAPISWLITSDVVEGRKLFNVSEWNRNQPEAKEAAEEVTEGEMPPLLFLAAHPEARLTTAERQLLIHGLAATFGTKQPEAVSAR